MSSGITESVVEECSLDCLSELGCEIFSGLRILRKHGYPPDKQEMATQTVLE